MDDLRGKYRIPYQGLDMDVGSNSAVLTRTFVAESLQQDQREDDGLGAFRGAINGVLISLVFWIALGVALFRFF
jgi:hypothetical protein